jgi:competence protein ComEA
VRSSSPTRDDRVSPSVHSVVKMDDMIFERLPRRHTALLLLVAVIALALVGRRLAAAGTATAPAAQAVSLSPGRGSEAAAPRLVVYVVGAVRRAGLVRVAEGARVADALERAGGPSRAADLTLVNLAAPVADGQQIVIPERAEGGAGGVAGVGAAVPAKVSLASATLEQLDGLPGIGPVTAQKILDWRQQHPLRSVDDLDAIPGIGPARVEQLRDLVTP